MEQVATISRSKVQENAASKKKDTVIDNLKIKNELPFSHHLNVPFFINFYLTRITALKQAVQSNH